MCWDTCKQICFKLGMMLNATKLCSLIPVWPWCSLKVTELQKARICAVIVLQSCMKELKCWWWLIIQGEWLWSHVHMVNNGSFEDLLFLLWTNFFLTASNLTGTIILNSLVAFSMNLVLIISVSVTMAYNIALVDHVGKMSAKKSCKYCE